eukprot:15350251-Ditylum_brightwellii.AAC.1
MPTMPGDGTYISAEDNDYNLEEYEDDLADDISRISVGDDEYSFDTKITSFESNFAEKKSHDHHTHGYSSGTPVAKFSGITALGLLFLLDSWHDEYGKGHISMQIHMLSGNKIEKQVTVRVSTHQDALVIFPQMSLNLSWSDCTFTLIVENPKSFDQSYLPILQQLLRIHSKSAACM